MMQGALCVLNTFTVIGCGKRNASRAPDLDLLFDMSSLSIALSDAAHKSRANNVFEAAQYLSVYSSRSLTELKLVLTYNRNDSDVVRGNKLVNMNSREVAMKNVQTYRAMSSICRQRAVFDPDNRWKHLGDAERWDRLAHVEIASHFRECNAAGSTETPTPGPSSNPSDTRWETIAAA
jgi:hypothetical protein